MDSMKFVSELKFETFPIRYNCEKGKGVLLPQDYTDGSTIFPHETHPNRDAIKNVKHLYDSDTQKYH